MFILDPLPFAYDALEPYIDAETMRLHHDKHHQTYVDKLNELVPEGGDLEKLIFSDNQKIKNMAGGVYNHNLFWKFLNPSYELPTTNYELRTAFTNAALSLFGSGWVWLTEDQKIISTANQDAPKEPVILGIDLWEHAYYLKYQNRRKDYLEAFWKLFSS